MERTLTQRGTERRDQLVGEASRLFAASGYSGTSVADICDACGVGKGVFYWYFDSKEALFRAILDDAVRGLRRAQRRAIEHDDKPLERIADGIRATLDFMVDNADLLRLFDSAATEPAFAEAYRLGIETVVEDTARHVKDAMVDGSIADGDPVFLAYGVTTVTQNFFRRFVLQNGSTGNDLSDVADAAVAFCLRGVTGV